MPRARAKVRPVVNFHARITTGEGRALAELVRRHGEKLAELGAAEADNKNAWFRSVIRRLAREAGFEIVEDEPAEVPAPAAAPRKRAAKRSLK